MIVIKCKSGKVFAATVAKYVDAEWKLQEAYYKAQGCTTEKVEFVVAGNCNCGHCKSLEHNFDDLIEEVRKL